MIRVYLKRHAVRLRSGGRATYWNLRWRDSHGRMRSKSIGRVDELGARKAEERRRELEHELNAGTVPRDRPSELTLAEWVRIDVDAIGADFKVSSVYEIENATRHLVECVGGATKLRQLGPAHVARFKAWMTARRFRPATIRKTLSTVRAALNRACEADVLHRNPFANVRMPQVGRPQVRVYSEDETRAIRDACTTTWWRGLVTLLEQTGLRKDEALNLTWRDVDLEQGLVTVAAKRRELVRVRGKRYPIIEWSAKRDSSYRSVPFGPETLEVLHRLRVAGGGSPYVFVTLERLAEIDRYLTERGLDRLPKGYAMVNTCRWSALQRRAHALLAERRGVALEDLDWPRGTIHDLRRTYGTRLATRGVACHVVQRFMGHASIKTTQAYYLGICDDDVERVRSAVAGDAPSRAPRLAGEAG